MKPIVSSEFKCLGLPIIDENSLGEINGGGAEITGTVTMRPNSKPDASMSGSFQAGKWNTTGTINSSGQTRIEVQRQMGSHWHGGGFVERDKAYGTSAGVTFGAKW